LDHLEQFRKLLDVLSKPGKQPKRPIMAPLLPDGFVKRTTELAQLKSSLINAKGDPVAITAALRGAGGFGKTVLATAIAHDEDIQNAFYDGILWVSIGESPSVIQIVSDLIYSLTEERASLTELQGAVTRLKEVLEHRCSLLIIDDVWQRTHLIPFLSLSHNTTLLITTRRDDVLPANTIKVPVDAMTASESIELLSTGLPGVGPTENVCLASLATERLGEWPILLQLVNGFLRARIERGERFGDAIKHVIERLDRRGLVAFDRTLESARAAAVESTVEVGIELLAEFDQTGYSGGYHGLRYSELSVFPENAVIPLRRLIGCGEEPRGLLPVRPMS
jgi:hypothetical protein